MKGYESMFKEFLILRKEDRKRAVLIIAVTLAIFCIIWLLCLIPCVQYLLQAEIAQKVYSSITVVIFFYGSFKLNNILKPYCDQSEAINRIYRKSTLGNYVLLGMAILVWFI